MGENSAIASDDDEGDEDEGDDGEEGEVNEDGGGVDGQGDDAMADADEAQAADDRQDQDMEDADDSVDTVKPSSIEEPTDDSQLAENDTEVIDTPQQAPGSLNLGAPLLGASHLFSPRQHEGSPLKNVMLQSPTEPKSMEFPTISSVQEVASGVLEPQLDADGPTQTAGIVQQEPETLDGGLAATEMIAQTTTILVPEGSAVDATEARGQVEETVTEVDTTETLEVTQDSEGPLQTETSVHISTFAQQSYHTSPTPSVLPSLREPLEASTVPPPQPLLESRPATEDDGLDLLGGLERELDRQAGTSITPAEEARQEQSPSVEKLEAQD
jgi:hypothetical protein